MTITELKEKVANAQATVEKSKNTLAKHIKRAEKQKKAINDLGWNENDEYQCYETASHDECYWAVVEYQHTLEDIKNTETKITKSEKILQNWNDKLNSQITLSKIIETEMPEVFKQCQKDLSTIWTELDIRDRDKMLTARKSMKYDEFRKLYSYNQESGLNQTDETFEKSNMRTAEMFIIDLYNRVKEVTGEVKDYSHITYKGNALNGFIIGEKGTVEVETILAGGYNIQRLHLRVLVKKIK